MIDFIIENPLINIEQEKIIKATNGFEFMINKTMTKILNERYIQKYLIDSLRKMKEIADLKGFWTAFYLKDKKEIPYELSKYFKERFYEVLSEEKSRENYKKATVFIDALCKLNDGKKMWMS